MTQVDALESRPLLVFLLQNQPEVEAGFRQKGVEVLDCRREDYETKPALKVGFHPSRVMQAQWTFCIQKWLDGHLKNQDANAS